MQIVIYTNQGQEGIKLTEDEVKMVQDLVSNIVYEVNEIRADTGDEITQEETFCLSVAEGLCAKLNVHTTYD